MAKKIILGILLALSIGVLVTLVVIGTRQDREYAEYYDEMAERVEPLSSEQRQFEADLSALDEKYRDILQGAGGLTLLFIDPDPTVGSEIAPLLIDAGYTCMLCVGRDKMPGDEGCLSEEEAQTMLENGWEICALWSPRYGVDGVEDVLEEYEACQTVYFPQGTYNAERDEQMRALGVNIVIGHGETGAESINTKSESPQTWHLTAVNWNESGTPSLLADAAEKSGQVVFEIPLNDNDDTWNGSAFTSMLRVIGMYEEEQLRVGTLPALREYRLQKERDKKAYEEEYLTQRADLQAKIDALKEQIAQIRAEYTAGADAL